MRLAADSRCRVWIPCLGYGNFVIYNYILCRLRRILAHHLPKDERMRIEGVTFIVTLLHPKSVGEIRLRSTDPLDPPIIDPHYFEDQHDVRAISEVS